MSNLIYIGYRGYFLKELVPYKKEIVLNLCDKLYQEVNTDVACNYYFTIADEEKRTKKKRYLREGMIRELDIATEKKHSRVVLHGPEIILGEKKHYILGAVIDLYDFWKNNNPLCFDCVFLFPYIKGPIEKFFKWASTIIGCHYGLIFVDENYDKVLSEIEAIPRIMWGDFSSGKTQKWEKELGFYCKESKVYTEYIRKAYWGNFLNVNHIIKLGGIKKVQKEAPAFLVEELPGGGGYIQLTESFLDFGKSGFKEKLMKLDKYFAPIILPGRPEVVW
ncbi:MAG: hypothetical protein HZC12_10260 [Nitrospirae bacterium]|nr:hypothetical protein [Nitrospirota bacterium]